MSTDLKDISLSGASLEPINVNAPQAVTKGTSKVISNTRAKRERRQCEDRRAELRFQDNRRSNKDRRPLNTWEYGHKL